MSKPYKPAVYREPRGRKPTVYRSRTASEEIAAIDSGIPQPPDVEAWDPLAPRTRLQKLWDWIRFTSV